MASWSLGSGLPLSAAMAGLHTANPPRALHCFLHIRCMAVPFFSFGLLPNLSRYLIHFVHVALSATLPACTGEVIPSSITAAIRLTKMGLVIPDTS